MRQRGFGLVEVLVAAFVMGLVLVALVASGSSVHRRSHESEGYALAALRARVLLDAVKSIDFEVLDRAGGPVLDLDRLFEPGVKVALFAPLVAGPGTARYLGRLQGFTDEVRWTRISPHIARVDVNVTWTDPLANAPRHEVKLQALMERPEAGFLVTP